MYSPSYDEIITGEFSANWKAFQSDLLPKHLIDPSKKPVTCACGSRFNSIIEWSSHATRGSRSE